MEKQELNIIIAGDSFSDDGSGNDIFNRADTRINFFGNRIRGIGMGTSLEYKKSKNRDYHHTYYQ